MLLRAGECVTIYEQQKQVDLPIVHSSRDVYNFLITHEYYSFSNITTREVFYAVYVNRRLKIIGIEKIAEGSDSGVIISVKHVVAAAVILKAYGAFLIHNHPSGTLSPSEHDKRVTHKIKKAFDYHDMKVVDHIIVTESGYFSFADDGIL
jgi:DNA repair protein RadC